MFQLWREPLPFRHRFHVNLYGRLGRHNPTLASESSELDVIVAQADSFHQLFISNHSPLNYSRRIRN